MRQEVGTVNSLPQNGAKKKLGILKPLCFWPISGPPHLSPVLETPVLSAYFPTYPSKGVFEPQAEFLWLISIL